MPNDQRPVTVSKRSSARVQRNKKVKEKQNKKLGVRVRRGVRRGVRVNSMKIRGEIGEEVMFQVSFESF